MKMVGHGKQGLLDWQAPPSGVETPVFDLANERPPEQWLRQGKNCVSYALTPAMLLALATTMIQSASGLHLVPARRYHVQ